MDITKLDATVPESPNAAPLQRITPDTYLPDGADVLPCYPIAAVKGTDPGIPPRGDQKAGGQPQEDSHSR